MTTFAVAYLLVWGAVAWYVLRLAARQRRLEDQLNQLDHRNEEPETPAQATLRAA